jgi:hypothetical protein
MSFVTGHSPGREREPLGSLEDNARHRSTARPRPAGVARRAGDRAHFEGQEPYRFG